MSNSWEEQLERGERNNGEETYLKVRVMEGYVGERDTKRLRSNLRIPVSCLRRLIVGGCRHLHCDVQTKWVMMMWARSLKGRRLRMNPLV